LLHFNVFPLIRFVFAVKKQWISWPRLFFFFFFLFFFQKPYPLQQQQQQQHNTNQINSHTPNNSPMHTNHIIIQRNKHFFLIIVCKNGFVFSARMGKKRAKRSMKNQPNDGEQRSKREKRLRRERERKRKSLKSKQASQAAIFLGVTFIF